MKIGVTSEGKNENLELSQRIGRTRLTIYANSD